MVRSKALPLDKHERMIAIMRQQRDSFLTPGGALGSAHGEQTRVAMGNLLDWFLVEFEGDASKARSLSDS